MEHVLEVYTRPYDPQRPQVCMDESPKQLVGETRTPLPAEPGQPARYDYEYVRNGSANLFMFFELGCTLPLRHTSVKKAGDEQFLELAGRSVA
jgi:hypothetical protein